MRILMPEEIRKAIEGPELGDDHFGKWGILNGEQRLSINHLLDILDSADCLIKDQAKKIKKLEKYDYRNIKIDDNNKIHSIHFTKEQLHWMNFGIALYVSMQNFDKINDENDI